MDKLILGILMLKRLTVYEMRALIKANFYAMCSDSLGSIQAAVKRLLKAEMVIFSEYVEKSVNKKKYSITDKGRKEFIKWLQVPANIPGAKNIELGKFMFLGMLPVEEHSSLIDGIIIKLEQDLERLLAIQNGISDESKSRVLEYWRTDFEYYGYVFEKSKEIVDYQELTLQYGIDNTKFNIEWFKKLKNRR